jgi:hypothetical protein
MIPRWTLVYCVCGGFYSEAVVGKGLANNNRRGGGAGVGGGKMTGVAEKLFVVDIVLVSMRLFLTVSLVDSAIVLFV